MGCIVETFNGPHANLGWSKKTPLLPPTMTALAFPDVNPTSELVGGPSAVVTRSLSAVSKVSPSEMLVSEGCMAAGAGASSVSLVQTLKHPANGRRERSRLEV